MLKNSKKVKTGNHVKMGRKTRNVFATYVVLVLMMTLGTMTVFATNDPLSVQRVIASLEGENLVTIKNRKMVISKEQYLKLLKK